METFNINLENFQSISGADLEFVPGVNLIVGQSNSGKTAILRAVRSVVANPTRGKYFIKKGSHSTEVTIKFDGNEISWKRTPSDIVYTVNGEVYKKAGRNDLFDIQGSNGFVRDDEDNIMNIEGEWDLPFPFDRTPSELFKLFENIFCISDSSVILKSFKDEEGAAVKEKLVLEEKLGRLSKRVEGLEELSAEVDVDQRTDAITSFGETIDRYKNLASDMQKVDNSVKFSTFKLDEIIPPVKDSLVEYLDAVKDLKFLTNVVKRQKFFKSLPDSVIVGDTIEKYIQAKADYNHLAHAKSLQDINFDVECSVDGSTLEAYESMWADCKDLERLSAASKFDIIEECNIEDNTIEKYEELLKDYDFIQKCYAKCKQLKAKYAEVDERANKAQIALSNYKVCPLCGHELEGES